MNTILWILLAITIVSLISLVGIITLGMKEKTLHRILPYLITFSGGALLGDTFLHILPELSEEGFHTDTAVVFLAGIVLFFFLEKFLHWHRCHTHQHEEAVHTRVYITQIGDTIHNMIDGVVIASSFFVSVPLGIASTIAIILHEIPQEIGNFGILIHGGWSKVKALWYNLLTALSAFIGGFIVIFMGEHASDYIPWLLALTGANFLYLALSDILPELHDEHEIGRILFHGLYLVFGIAIMVLLLGLEGGR